ncbi:hypothetical protein IGI04_003098 [Brassica rapa subsp. trilocularis]|uniref:Uncharacterized protein n=1 Tax=Brassica rapa subsp. trilocularis TaxID=1813537 RepID=A0ABQ7NXE0_BRACM|nr:hypothetical protein IGI04_003098 [Brassica rapa subsp. trilocularis]
MPLSPFMDLLQLAGWLFLNATFASSTSSIKYGGVNKIETVTVSELNTYVVNSKPQEAGELMNYAADGNISLFPGVDLKLRFNSYRVFLWVKSMLFIMRVYKRESSIFVTGLSIYTVPVEICEKLAIPEAEWPRAIGELCGLIYIKEALTKILKDAGVKVFFIHFLVMLCYCFAHVSLKRGRDMAELVPKYGLPSLAQRHG